MSSCERSQQLRLVQRRSSLWDLRQLPKVGVRRTSALGSRYVCILQEERSHTLEV
jgi:hypothetical protein